MSSTDWRDCLDDLIEALERYIEHARGVRYEEFAGDARILDAVRYEVVVAGHAVCEIPDSVRKRYPEIPWETLRSLQELIAHEHLHEDPEVLWDMTHRVLPPVLPLLRAVRGEIAAERVQRETAYVATGQARAF